MARTTKTTKTTATAPETQESQVDLELQAAEAPAVDEAPALAVVEQASSELTNLPSIDDVLQTQPARSYKSQFAITTWGVSEDGGENTEDTGTAVISGSPVDLCLMISRTEPGEPREFDFRLRLAFHEQDGTLAEVNLNAISVANDGELYVPGPARSLISALQAIAESPADIEAYKLGLRLEMVTGKNKRSRFINVAVPGARWVPIRGNYSSAPRTAEQLIDAIKQLKSRLLLEQAALPGPAVLGEDVFNGEVDAVDVSSEEVPF